MTEPTTAVALLAGVALFVGAAGALRARRAQRRLLALQLDGLLAIRRLKQLLDAVQTHRGLVNMQRNGATGVQRRINAQQAEVTRLQGSIDQETPSQVLLGSRWPRIGRYWHDVVNTLPELSADESFTKHSALIRQLLFLIQDVADHSRLSELPASVVPGGGDAVRTLVVTLPGMAEHIGQARALGAGVAAARQCSSVARIRLRFLRQQVADAFEHLRGAASDAGPTAAKAVQALVTGLDEHLITPSQPAISADRYFEVATEALTAIYLEFDQRSDDLMRRLR